MAAEKNSWVKDLLVAFAATTLSIVLTFGTTGVVNRIKQKQERKLTALMVMSSIEEYAHYLEVLGNEDLARVDSVAAWLLSLPIEDVVKLGDEPLAEALDVIAGIPVVVHDHSAETIFSSNIDTWKRMGNFRFIDNVGSCFSAMNGMEEYFNEEFAQYNAARTAVLDHPSDYPGGSKAEKLLRNELFRRQLLQPNYFRRWLPYCAEVLREANRHNMHMMGITEKEVLDFTENKGVGDKYEEKYVDIFDFEKPQLDIDSLAMQLSYARQADSLLRVMKGSGK